MAEPLRALFVNEGALGAAVLGHARVARTVERVLTGAGLDARFAVLPPMSRATTAAVRQIPGLGHADLDLQPVRWHLAQAVRARRVIGVELGKREADVLNIHAHTLSFLSVSHMRRIPTLLALDATVEDWARMGIWRRARPYTGALLAPSLALERRAMRAAAAVLGFTRWGCEAAARRAPGARVIEHHPGVDLTEFRPLERPAAARPRVLFVGGRFAEKGGHDLLAALSPHLDREIELDLVTPADIAPRPGLRVHRLGPSDEALTELYRRADIFCLPTLGDAVPLSVVEAMACRTAVVTTAVGGIRDLLDDGRAGRLIPMRNPRALREAVLALAGDSTARDALGAAGRARCEERYDAAVQSRRLVDIMRTAVAAGPPRG